MDHQTYTHTYTQACAHMYAQKRKHMQKHARTLRIACALALFVMSMSSSFFTQSLAASLMRGQGSDLKSIWPFST